MAATAVSTFKPLSKMVDSSCIFSSPFIFTSKPPTPQHQCLSMSLKQPIKLYLSYSHSSSPLSINPYTRFTKAPFVAQTSDWAPQQAEEDGTEGEESNGVEAGLSDLDQVEREDASVEEIAESGEEGGEFGEGDFVEPPEDAKVYVGNLPYDVDSEKLAMLFEEAGTVEIAEVIYNRATDTSRGFGFVTMSTVEEAEKAVELFHRYDLGGRLLTVNKASPRGAKVERPPRVSQPGSKIYVGNLSWDVDDSKLEQVFSEHGKVVSARVVTDRDTGRSRGFGFVTMSSETELNDAIAALDGQSLEGRALRVNVAEDRPRPSSY